MNLTKTTVTRLEGSMKCGCKARGEYEDAECKKIIGEIEFLACPEHVADLTATGILTMVLGEFVEKEAREMVPSPRPIPLRPHRPASAAQSNAGDTVVGEGGAVERTPMPARTDHRPGIRRADPRTEVRHSIPGQHRPARPGEVNRQPAPRPTARTASAAAPMEMDIGEVAEDLRVTRLIEAVDFLAMGELNEHEM